MTSSAGAAAHSESQRSREKADELRKRADRLERRAANFEKGRQGELLVSAALNRLVPAGFAVIDDVHWPGTKKSNIDHVVYGPPGMFVIDAKNWTGNVTVKAGVLRVGGYGHTRDTDKVAEAAASLQAHLGASGGVVHPVICMAGQPTLPGAWCGRTFVVGLDNLGAWLFRKEAVWPASHVAALSDWLPHVLTPADPGGVITITKPNYAPAAPTSPPPGVALPRPRRAAPSMPPPKREGGLFGWLRNGR